MNQLKESVLQLIRTEILDDDKKAFIIKDKYNCNYVTGYTGDLTAVILTQFKNYIIVNSLYTEQVKQETKDYIPVIQKNNPNETIAEILQSGNIDTIIGEFDSPEEVCKNFNVKNAICKKDFITDKRIIKYQYELDCIRKANMISCDAFNHCLQFIKPGVTELDIAAEIEYYMKKHGSYHTAFDTIVVSGTRSAMPHGTPSEKKLQPGDPVTLDFGAVYRSYCADITRTVFVGKPNDEMKKIYNLVLEAQTKTVDFVKAGLTGIEVDAYAREIITSNGYGDYFVHGLGHGVGLQVHEAPSLNKRGTVPITENSVITVEPGIYIGNVGGVRIEDSVIVNKTGVEILTKNADKKLLIL